MVPFHDLRRNGGESEKRTPCSQRVITPDKNFWKVFLKHDTAMKRAFVNNKMITLGHN